MTLHTAFSDDKITFQDIVDLMNKYKHELVQGDGFKASQNKIFLKIAKELDCQVAIRPDGWGAIIYHGNDIPLKLAMKMTVEG